MVERPRNTAERNRLLLRLETLENEIKEIKRALSVAVDFDKVKLTITRESLEDWNDSADEDNEERLESNEMTVAEYLNFLGDNNCDMGDNPFTEKFFRDGLTTESFAEFIRDDCRTVNFSTDDDLDELRGYNHVYLGGRHYYASRVRFIGDKNKNIIGMIFLVRTDTLDVMVEVREESFHDNLEATTFFKACYNAIKQKISNPDKMEKLLEDIRPGYAEDDDDDDDDDDDSW